MREQEERLAKVKKSCNTAHTVTNICKILLLILAACCLIGAVICFIFRGQITQVLASAFAADPGAVSFADISTNGVVHLEVAVDGLVASGQYGLIFGIYCIAATVITGAAAAIFHLIGCIFKRIEKSESPFSEEVILSLKRTFIILTILTALFTGLGPAVFLGLFLWCIYNIMKYGAALQAEIDETL